MQHNGDLRKEVIETAHLVRADSVQTAPKWPLIKRSIQRGLHSSASYHHPAVCWAALGSLPRYRSPLAPAKALHWLPVALDNLIARTEHLISLGRRANAGSMEGCISPVSCPKWISEAHMPGCLCCCSWKEKKTISRKISSEEMQEKSNINSMWKFNKRCQGWLTPRWEAAVYGACSSRAYRSWIFMDWFCTICNWFFGHNYICHKQNFCDIPAVL